MPYRIVLLASLAAAVAFASVTHFFADRVPVSGLQSAPIPIADVATERLTRSGPVVGFTDQAGTHAWLGIPYAGPPTGPMRWRAPAPPEPWLGTFDALTWAPGCARPVRLPGESDEAGSAVLGREDCLHLNVWSPSDEVAESGDGLRPVMVWVDGWDGGGVDSLVSADGATLAARQDVVVVSISYRVGVIGFFAHPALMASAPRGERTANFGTLDLVMGLQWVRDNIEAFGGDPSNVTIFGASSGADQVMSLLLALPAEGLFHRAIVQGGILETITEHAATAPRDAEPPGLAYSSSEIVVALLEADGSLVGPSEARRFADDLEPVETADYLRSRSLRDLFAVTSDLERLHPGTTHPRLVRDGVVLPSRPPLEVLGDSNAYNAVPIILGSNRDQAKGELAHDPAFVKRYLDRFYRIDDPEHYETLARLESASLRARGVDEPAGLLRTAQGPSVWVYRFDWDDQPVAFGADLRTLLGAGHGLEVPFVFGHFRFADRRFGHPVFDETNRGGRSRLSEAMMSYWGEFAWTGSPGRGRQGLLPAWQPWDEDHRVPGRFLVFDSPRGGGVRMAAGKVTSQHVIDEVEAASGLAARERCRVLVGLLGDPAVVARDEATDPAARACREAARRNL